MKNKQEQRSTYCSEPDLGDQFGYYVHGNVSPSLRKRIEDHLAQCEECRGEVRFFMDLKGMKKSLAKTAK